MTDETTYQVRRYRVGGGGTGSQIATGLRTLGEAVEIALRLTLLQDELGGNDEFCILPE